MYQVAQSGDRLYKVHRRRRASPTGFLGEFVFSRSAPSSAPMLAAIVFSTLALQLRPVPRPPPGFAWSTLPEHGFSVAEVATEPMSAAPPASAAATVGRAAPTMSSAPTEEPKAKPTEEPKAKPTTSKASRRRPSSKGIFAPLVMGSKRVMGEKELNKLRADVIAQHTKVISSFVDTSESPFGQIVLRRMFEAADKDGNGTLDRNEILSALRAMGFDFIGDEQVDTIMSRADIDKNEVIDFEEFVRETPRTLRSSLVKLAKQNGHNLGFLA